jgi:phosphoglycolate phosphatase
VLDGLGLADDCRWLVGGDTLSVRKPDPGPVEYVMEQAGVGPERTLLVGDSETDVATARAAGCSVVVFRYGYNQGFEGADVQPDAFVESLPGIGIAESA